MVFLLAHRDWRLQSLTTISFLEGRASGSGYEAWTSQNVPPRSAQILIEWSGTLGICGWRREGGEAGIREAGPTEPLSLF